MGEAKRKREQASVLAAKKEALIMAAAKVSSALRRLFTAASEFQGADCYAHAAIGGALLKDLGFDFEMRVGYAAWRVGDGDGDVISHVKGVQSYVPAGQKGFAYHAWLVSDDWLIDFTTYQLPKKARELDACDGGSTQVDWRPDYLLLTKSQIKGYKAVAQALHSGVAYYESDSTLTQEMKSGYSLDLDDIEMARQVMRNPQAAVFGPSGWAAA